MRAKHVALSRDGRDTATTPSVWRTFLRGCALVVAFWQCLNAGSVRVAGTAGNGPLPGGPHSAPVLVTIQQVRQLTRAQAAAHVDVQLTGVVNCLVGGLRSHGFFFADGTGGISVELPPGAAVRLGNRVAVTGVSAAGKFAPVIQAKTVQVLGNAPPPPPRRVIYADLIGGMQDSQPVEVEGIVHSAVVDRVFGRDYLVLSLDMGGGTLRVTLQEFRPDDASRLVDATVRVRGVCLTNHNEKGQFVSPGLAVPLRAGLEVLRPAGADPFSGPATPVGDVLRFGSDRHLIRVIGTVTYQVPGRILYLQQGNDGIRVQTGSEQVFALGQQVEAAGFPLLGEYSPILTDSRLRAAGSGVPSRPAAITAAEVIVTHSDGHTRALYDQQLVQLHGTLMERHTQSGQVVSLLLDGGKSFEASLALPDGQPSADFMKRLTPGSVLQLTGICSVHTDLDRYPTSFTVLLRSPADVVVLQPAPWWNTAHLLTLLSASTAGVLAATLWVGLLRAQVRRQTSLLRASEEKYRYLATHDSLTGLLNRAAVLEALHAGFEEARQRRAELGVAVVDLDHFKSVNDTLGHNAGDEVLRQAAKRLSSAIRQSDVVGRYGGEEFLVVFRNMNRQLSVERCETIRMTLSSEPVVLADRSLRVTASIGIACTDPGLRSVDELIAQADAAMYQAKTGGRNRVVYFSPPSAGHMAGEPDRSSEPARLDDPACPAQGEAGRVFVPR